MKRQLTLILTCIIFNTTILAQTFQPVWQFTDLGQNNISTGLQVLDVDNTGSKEIVFGNTSIFLGTRNQNNEITYKSYSFRGALRAYEVVDINQDSLYEIFAVDIQGFIHILDASSLERISLDSTGINLANAIAVADADGDGVMEVFVASSSGMKAFSYANGNISFINDIPVFDCARIAIEDIDGDGMKEIITGASANSSRIFSSVAPGFALDTVIRPKLGKFSVADINNNGRKEIIYSSGSSLKVLDGQTLTEITSFDTGKRDLYGLKTYDLDDNGSIEFLIGSGTKLYAYSSTGTFLWESNDSFGQFISFAVADIDTDNQKEIIWGEYFGGIRIADLQTLQDEYESKEYFVINYHLDDFDKDGSEELVIHTIDSDADRKAYLQVLDPVNYIADSISLMPDSIKGLGSLSSGSTRNLSQKELIWLSGASLVVFDPIQHDYVFVRKDSSNRVKRSLEVADIDNDGISEILIGYDNQDLEVYQFDGTTYVLILIQKLGSGSGGIYNLVVGNLDQDADIEIAFTTNFKIQVYNYPSLTLQWETGPDPVQYRTLLAVDINQDGQDEIFSRSSNSIYKYNGADGQLIQKYTPPFRQGFQMEDIAVANFDSSPELEVLIGYSTEILVMDSGFVNTLTEVYVPEVVINNFSIADVDGDNRLDMFFRGQRGIYHYEQDFASSIAENIDGAKPLVVYPNPTFNSARLEVPNWSAQKAFFYKVIDLHGQVVFEKEVNSADETLDLSAVASGSYFILLYKEEQIAGIGRIIKR